jgi:multidrug resistance efflux pump
MLHVTTVLLALVAARAARFAASLELPGEEAEFRRTLTRQKVSGRHADVVAIQVQTDAARQLVHVILGETSVRASSTGLRTVEARFDALC